MSHDPDPQQEIAWARNFAPDAKTILGYYGEVYFRAHYFKTTDGKHEGHYHYRDHVSFLWKGSARVEWKAPDGRYGSKDYKAGDFVIVSKDVEHTIIPLEPDTGWICIFAVPQDEGGEPFHSERMDPTHG